MTERTPVAPPEQIKVTFTLSAAHTALSSLMLLHSDYPGMDEWVSQTVHQLTPEQAASNEWIVAAAYTYLGQREWPSFLAWVDDLSARDPVALRDQALDQMLSEMATCLEGPLSNRETLLSDEATYLEWMERLYECRKGATADREKVKAGYARLKDPARRQQEMVAHLRDMWQTFLSTEWERKIPALRESVAALRSLDYTGQSLDEIMKRVTDRELPREWEHLVDRIREVTFIPSPHIGPYLLLADYQDARAQVVFRARIPGGVNVRSPALTRSELAMRFSALADDTRLRILELVAQQGEQRAQDVIAKLELSQSAASRHLRQLTATGYLIERRCEGAKCYRLNPDRIAATFNALQAFLQ